MEASQTTSNTRKRTVKADLKKKLKDKIKTWNSDHRTHEYRVEDLRRSLEDLLADFKIKKQLYKWNTANPPYRVELQVEGLRRSLEDLQDELKTKKQLFKWNQANPPYRVGDLRRSLEDLQDELKTKKQLFKWNQANPPQYRVEDLSRSLKDLKKDFNLKKQRKKYIDNQEDSTSDVSTEASAASRASTTSSNPGLLKKKRTSPFGTSPKFMFDKHQPPVTQRFEDHQNCDENIQTHLPDEMLQSTMDMALDADEDDLVDGEQVMEELRNNAYLQANRMHDSDDDDADNLMSNLFLSERINGEG
jgi:hypothetical protein